MADVELYKKYRPQAPSELVGQDDAMRQVKDMIMRNEVPHCLLFVGPSGCGKTTLARMLSRKLGCDPDKGMSNPDYREINASDNRGIEMVREMLETVNMSALSSKCKVYVIDEAQGLTPEAQSALLKPLEDGYQHVYFMLCTTDPQKLKQTIKTRSTQITLQAVQVPGLKQIVQSVLAKEGKVLDDEIVTRIAEAANNSPRKALVLLHQVIGIPDREAQIRAIGSGEDPESDGFKLAQMIYRRSASWKDVATLCQRLKDSGKEPEMVRRIVLGYGRSILAKGEMNQFVRDVMEEFRFNYFDTGDAGLLMSCYQAVLIGNQR